jgi:Tfp pilus assembly protein PilE
MAGNAMDQSSLLVALLRNTGVPCRYVTGNLSWTDARTLVMSMFPSSGSVIGMYRNGTQLEDPSTNMTLLSEARNHTWVEYYVGEDKWISLDPSFTRAGVNDSFCAPTDRFTEVYDNWRHHVRIGVTVERWELFGAMNGRLAMNTVFNEVFPTAQLTGKNVYMTHDVTKKPHGRESLPFGGINPYYYETVTYQDKLVIENETVFGNTYVETFYPTASYELLSEEFLAQWLDITVSAPDGTSEVVSRTIFDKVGYEYRRADRSCYLGSPMMERDPPIIGVEVYSILVAPCRVPFSAVERQGEIFNETYETYKEALKHDTTKAEKQALADAVHAKHVELLHLASLSLGRVSDARDFTTSEVLQIKSYYNEPRVLMASFETKDPEFYFILDLRKNEIRALGYPGTASDMKWRYTEPRSMTDSDAEHELMTKWAPNQTVVSTRAIFKAAHEQNITVAIIQKEWSFLTSTLNISSEAKKRIQRAVEAGKRVIVPIEMVMHGGKERIAWWEQTVETGQTYGVSETGLHFTLCGLMCAVAIVGILNSIATTAIGVAVSTEEFNKAMDLYADAFIAIVDWVSLSAATTAEFKAKQQELRDIYGKFVAQAAKTLLLAMELIAAGIADAGGSVMDFVGAGPVKNFFGSFKIDIINTGLTNAIKTQYRLNFPDNEGSASVSLSHPITDVVGIVSAQINLAATFCPTLSAAASAVPSALSLAGAWATAICSVFKIGVGAAIAGVLGAHMVHLRNIAHAVGFDRPFDPPVAPDLPHNTTANVSAIADLSGNQLSGTIYTSHLLMEGNTGVAGGLASTINHTFEYDNLVSASASVYDGSGTLVGSGAVSASSVSPYATIEGHASYNFTGSGTVSVHGSAAPSVAATGDLDSYSGGASRTKGSLSVLLLNANVTIGGSTYIGTCRVVCKDVCI